MTTRYFLTVDLCRRGKRGIFCDQEGNAFSKEDEPHTLDEMREILGPFWLVLGPESKQFSEEEAAACTDWFPLGEYREVYGYAVVPEATQ